MARKYTTSYLSPERLVTSAHRTKAGAIAHAKTISGYLVRVSTPAGNLVKYVDNRVQA